MIWRGCQDPGWGGQKMQNCIHKPCALQARERDEAGESRCGTIQTWTADATELADNKPRQRRNGPASVRGADQRWRIRGRAEQNLNRKAGEVGKLGNPLLPKLPDLPVQII